VVERIERIDERFARMEARLDGLETRMREGFEGVDSRIDELANRISQVEVRFTIARHGEESIRRKQ
jgi:phage shock protein A